MSARHPEGAIRPFNKSGYEILDDAFEAGEVVIWSVSATRPRAGDVLLIERGGRPYDIAVEEIRTFRGGWSASCRVARGLTRPA